MRRYLCFIVLCVFVFSLFAIGCTKQSQGDESSLYLEESEMSPYSGYRNTVLYYETDNGFMVPVMRPIPWEEGIGKAALGYLVDSSENRASIAPYGLKAPIPEGTQLSLRIIEGRHANVELSDFPVEALEKSAYNMVTAIVNTLTEFPSVDTVSVMADGAPISELLEEASLPAELSAMALNVEDASIETGTGQSFPLTLYFSNKSGSLHIPVTRYSAMQPDFSLAVQALIDGPQDKSLLSCFPEGTRLLGAEINDDGSASVDLSSEYSSVNEIEGLAEASYETLLLTAQAFGKVSALDILVEGEPYFMDAVSTMAPIYVNKME